MIIDGNDQRLAVTAATQLQQAGAQQALVPKSSSQLLNAGKGNTAEVVQAVGGDTVSIKVDLPQNTVDTLKRIGNTSDILNALASNLRQTSAGLTAANTITEKMKTTLDVVVKNYPPYPVEDRGRMEQLMNYSSLRNQLQSMMIPAPPPPLYGKIKHMWENLVSGQDGTIQAPSLPQDAIHSHVNAAAKQLDAISSQISLVQETMTNSVLGT